MRQYNFSAGPATIDESVLRRAQSEFLEYSDCGAAVFEISHRGAQFMALQARIEANLRTLLSIPDHYHVLFLQGGATLQFSGVPNNLLAPEQPADYIVTGMWSAKALDLGQRYSPLHCLASSESTQFTCLPEIDKTRIHPQAGYVHIASNETVHGVQFNTAPDTGDVPLVADMSSDLLSRPIDINDYGLIYAGAQKNIGPAGVTLVIVRDDLLGRCRESWPDVFNYQAQLARQSMLNTPPTFAIYLAGLVFEWLLEQGGLQTMALRNQRKANKLYQAIDQSNFYRNDVDPSARSQMNVPFFLPDDAMQSDFLAQAQNKGLLYLKGHKAVGGLRASIYNAMPEEGVDALVDFMHSYARQA